ncbi:MAG: sigma-70 family RNA polymerase sigma factor [Thermodesulfobacteriota bacterium]|nr:sigma-70 family RNA polymerase sigma factor [Thermodesulfobacteriota bacterium]
MKILKSRAAVFEGLVVPHMEMLYRAAWRLTGRPDEAEDLVQQVMVNLYSRTREMHKVERMGPWLRKVLYREFVDGLRKKARRPEYYSADAVDVGDIQAGTDNPEKLVERAGDRDRVRKALDELTAHDRAIVVMHLAEGYTVAELSDIFNVPSETMKTRLRRARGRLKKILMK